MSNLHIPNVNIVLHPASVNHHVTLGQNSGHPQVGGSASWRVTQRLCLPYKGLGCFKTYVCCSFAWTILSQITHSNADRIAYSSTKPNIEKTSCMLHLTGETLTGC